MKRGKNGLTKSIIKNWYIWVVVIIAISLEVTRYYEFSVLEKWLINLGAIIAGLAVFIQIKDAKDISTGNFVLGLQNEFTASEYGMDIYLKCWKEYSERKDLLGENDIKNIVSYLTFFESLYIMYTKNVLSMETLDDLFGRRFFVVVNNKNVQKLELLPNRKYYRNIYFLYVEWKKYRIKHMGKSDEKVELFCYGGDFAQKYDACEKVIKLEEKNNKELEVLIEKVESALENEEFWLPISKVSREHFWDEAWTEFYGIYENEKLVAAGALFLDENEYGENAQKLGLTGKNVAEIGRLMVHPEYRKSSYMTAIVQTLKSRAKKREMEYLVATAHPDNKGSRNVLEWIGMEEKENITKQKKYPRKIYMLNLRK